MPHFDSEQHIDSQQPAAAERNSTTGRAKLADALRQFPASQPGMSRGAGASNWLRYGVHRMSRVSDCQLMSQPRRLLLVDACPDGSALQTALRQCALPDATTGTVSSEAVIVLAADDAALSAALAEEPFDAVVASDRLWMDLPTLLRAIGSQQPAVPVVVVCEEPSVAACVAAFKAGVADYLPHTPEGLDRLPHAIAGAIARAGIRRQKVESERRRMEEMHDATAALESQIIERTRVAERRSHQLRMLAAELTKAEERERRRLAQVLHDDLQQMLVAARMHLSAVPLDAPLERVEEFIAHIDDLLDRSIRLSRNLTLKFSPPALYDAGLAPALEWLGGQVSEEHGLEIEVDCDDTAQPEAQDTRVLLYQSVRELLFNVVKHTKTPWAKLSMHHGGEGTVQVSVCDEGQGFDPEVLANTDLLHARFGLFSIRERLELIGGRMEIESIAGQGACVRLFAPQRMTAEERAGNKTDPSLMALDNEEDAMPALPPHAGAPIRVLLADDHRIMRASLAGLLRSQPGLEVVGQAADGQEVIDQARLLKPDVVVMDVTMPVVDGVEATRILTEEMPNLSVIALSMHEKEDMQQAMRQAGASRYLTKDGPPELLIGAIRSSVHRRDGHRKLL